MDGQTYYSGSFFANLAVGTYTCYVKDNNGCITSIEVTVNTSGLAELSFAAANLYPNPNNGSFEIQIEGVQGQVIEAKLFNVLGQQISVFKLYAQNGSIKQPLELSPKIAAGTYYLGLYDGQQAAVLQFIKK
jgi:hypothetical protein